MGFYSGYEGKVDKVHVFVIRYSEKSIAPKRALVNNWKRKGKSMTRRMKREIGVTLAVIGVCGAVIIGFTTQNPAAGFQVLTVFGALACLRLL